MAYDDIADFHKFSYNREIRPLRGVYFSHFNDALTSVFSDVDVEKGTSMKKGFNLQGDEIAIGYKEGQLICVAIERDENRRIVEKIGKDGISEVEITDKSGVVKIIRTPGKNAVIEENGKVLECADNYDYPKRLDKVVINKRKS